MLISTHLFLSLAKFSFCLHGNVSEVFVEFWNREDEHRWCDVHLKLKKLKYLRESKFSEVRWLASFTIKDTALVNSFWRKKVWEHWNSNPGLLGVKGKRYHQSHKGHRIRMAQSFIVMQCLRLSWAVSQKHSGTNIKYRNDWSN